MLLIRHRFFRLATVAILWVMGYGAPSPAQNASDLRLVPFPKNVSMDEGQRFSLKTALQLHVPASDRDVLVVPLLDELKRAGFPEPRVVESSLGQPLLALFASGAGGYDASPTLPEQAGEGRSDAGESYAIVVSPDGIVCRGGGDVGLYYAVQTLRQLIRANVDADGTLPCLTIRDWPSMKYRCYQDDWTRGPSPHLDAVLHTLDLGSHLKHNMFTYYMENQFEFKKHPKLNPKDGTLTQEEFRHCVEYAAKRHVNILGNQQSFGHSGKTIALPEYMHLGEAGYILSPVVEEVYSFLDDLYSEITPLVPFGMFNVCCDETWDLAKSGPSKELADEIGVAGVYVQHILRIRELLKKYDKRMLMWGDIIMNHPDKLELIPKDVVMMCWDYVPRSDYDSWIKPFSDSGYEFFVCPGLWNWSVMLPQTRHAMVNIQNFVRDGCKHGAIGMLNTAWEDDGEALHGYNWHLISWGAECSWNASKTDPADFNKRIGAVLFGAKGDDFGRAIELLAEVQDSQELDNTRNARFWEQDFLPRQSARNVERKATRILEWVRPAIQHLKTTKEQATVNGELLDSFLLGAARIELIATRMLAGLEVAKLCAEAAALDLSLPDQKNKAIAKLGEMEEIVAKVREDHRRIEKEFVRIWHTESKPYSLDRVTKRYDDLDQWFAEIENRIKNIRQKVIDGQIDATLPDIGLNDGIMARKTLPTHVVTSHLSPETRWAVPESKYRMGVTVEAGNVDRFHLPVELEISVPEPLRDKAVSAFLLSADGSVTPIPSQMDPMANKPTQRLTLIVAELKSGQTAKIQVYFGLDHAVTPFPTVSTFDGGDGMIVIENDLVQIHLGSEGGHAYKWLVKDCDNLDMTDPGDDSYHGFSDHRHADRHKKFDLVCMNRGPAMVRYGCFFDDELVKTLTVYAGLPILDVIVSMPTINYWEFDNPENFAADGKTPGTYLFSSGKTGPVPSSGSITDVQIRGFLDLWVIKTNEQGLALGITTPDAPAYYVAGPGGGMGGVGVDTIEPRSHFVTYAGRLAENSPSSIMERLRVTYNLKNQPVVTRYALEQP